MASSRKNRRLHYGVCRVCGCTEADCRKCVEKTGRACAWVEPDLCTACLPSFEVCGLRIVSDPGLALNELDEMYAFDAQADNEYDFTPISDGQAIPKGTADLYVAPELYEFARRVLPYLERAGRLRL